MMRRVITAVVTMLAVVLAAVAANAQQRDPKTAPYTGPRKRVAVSKFDAVGAFVAQNGGSDIGGGLAAQLVTELTNSGRFIVLERAELPNVLREQELGLSKVATTETAPHAGQIFGAQLLVRGSVTEFSQSVDGSGKQLGLTLAGATLGVGTNRVTGRVALDIRLIDATSSQIIESGRAEAKITQRVTSADIAAGPLSLGKSSFDQTALGRATRDAIAQAVRFIVARMETVPWTGRVIDVSDGQLYVNAGQDTNLKPGQRLVVSTITRELTDPATGEKLGVLERRLGEIEIQVVHEKFSVARLITPMQAARGDVVRVTGEKIPDVAETNAPAFSAPPPSESGPALDAIRQAMQDFEVAAASGNSTPMLPTGGSSFGPPAALGVAAPSGPSVGQTTIAAGATTPVAPASQAMPSALPLPRVSP
jgi:curli biogenesis system outer membrane secretion channel CsgG